MPWTWTCHKCGCRYSLATTRRCLNDGHIFCQGVTEVKRPLSAFNRPMKSPLFTGDPARPATASAAKPSVGYVKQYKKHKACDSAFDYQGWAAWGEWRRDVAAMKAHKAAYAQDAVAARRSALQLETGALDGIASSNSSSSSDESSDSDCSNVCDFPSECEAKRRQTEQLRKEKEQALSPSVYADDGGSNNEVGPSDAAEYSLPTVQGVEDTAALAVIAEAIRSASPSPSPSPPSSPPPRNGSKDDIWTTIRASISRRWSANMEDIREVDAEGRPIRCVSV